MPSSLGRRDACRPGTASHMTDFLRSESSTRSIRRHRPDLRQRVSRSHDHARRRALRFPGRAGAATRRNNPPSAHAPDRSCQLARRAVQHHDLRRVGALCGPTRGSRRATRGRNQRGDDGRAQTGPDAAAAGAVAVAGVGGPPWNVDHPLRHRSTGRPTLGHKGRRRCSVDRT